ncbi:MAG: hypothetical protein R2861_00100 [Desulfobacterales bacterium]
MALKGEKDYPFIGDTVVSSDGVEKPDKDYLKITNEYVDKNNTSKWTRLSRASYAVGALARFNNNHKLLRPEAAKIAENLKLKPVCHNPFMNNAAQLVESFHIAYEMIRLIDELINSPMAETVVPVKPKAGEGVGIVEAPGAFYFTIMRTIKTGALKR